MNQLQRALAEIKKYLGEMSVSQRLLIAALAAVAVMALVLTGRFSAQPGMVALTGLDPDNQDTAVSVLRDQGFEVRQTAGQVMVAAGQRTSAVSALAQSGELPDDTTVLFGNLIEKQSWRNSREQNQQQFIFALQNELNRVLAGFSGIRQASVFIDDPEKRGLGAAVEESTASVTLWPSGGSLTQAAVDAAAAVVAGARAGLSPDNVRVIDGSTGMPRDITNESRRLSGTYLEHARAVEDELRSKIERQIHPSIPSAIVTVSAQVDVRTVSEQRRRFMPRGEGTESLIASETTTEREQSAGGQDAAEPGIRSNQEADINEAQGSGGASFTEADTDTTFQNAIGETVRQTVDPRGVPTRLAASVTVPQSAVEDLLLRDDELNPPLDPDDPPPPITPERIETRFQELRASIEASVQPHLKIVVPDAESGQMTELTGEIAVAMMPAPPPLIGPQQSAGLFGMLGGPGGGGGDTLQLVETVFLGLLAFLALGMMLMMVRKAGKRIELPSPEDLVGVPPQLAANQDLVGQAEEGDAEMPGIEVDDDEIVYQRMLEQITDMVSNDPERSAALLHQWSDDDDD